MILSRRAISVLIFSVPLSYFSRQIDWPVFTTPAEKQYRKRQETAISLFRQHGVIHLGCRPAQYDHQGASGQAVRPLAMEAQDGRRFKGDYR